MKRLGESFKADTQDYSADIRRGGQNSVSAAAVASNGLGGEAVSLGWNFPTGWNKAFLKGRGETASEEDFDQADIASGAHQKSFVLCSP